MGRLAANSELLNAYGLAFKAHQRSAATRAAAAVGRAATKAAPIAAESLTPEGANDLSGDLLHGHGPHRGNLGKLLKYWRPIMKKPGGWRRCVLTLADEPGLGDIKALCAWLHHETTGKWPNEGNHSRRNRHIVERALKKSDPAAEDFAASDRRFRLRAGRTASSVAFAPLDGSVGQRDYKALWFRDIYNVKTAEEPHKGPKLLKIPKIGAGAQGRVGGAVLPDVIQDEGWKPNAVRSATGKLRFGALAHGLGIGKAIGIDKSRTERVSKFIRCPAGTVKGGTYTQKANQQCGGSVLSLHGDAKKLGHPVTTLEHLAKPNHSAHSRVVAALRGDHPGNHVLVRADGAPMHVHTSLDALGRMSHGHPDIHGSTLSVANHIKRSHIAAFGSGVMKIDSADGTLTATHKLTTTQVNRIRRAASKIPHSTPDDKFAAEVAKLSKGSLKFTPHKPKAA